jgi:hypothetical protein
MFERIINPLLRVFHSKVDEDIHNGASTTTIFADNLIWAFYHSIWVLPIYTMCFFCSMFWYQDIADHTYQIINGKPKKQDLNKGTLQLIYGIVIWLFIFLEMKLFTEIAPFLLDIIERFVLTITSLTSNSNLATILINQSISISIRFIFYVSKLLGYFLMSILYGWYSFDYYWASENKEPDERYSIIEKNWSYFLGKFIYIFLYFYTYI